MPNLLKSIFRRPRDTHPRALPVTESTSPPASQPSLESLAAMLRDQLDEHDGRLLHRDSESDQTLRRVLDVLEDNSARAREAWVTPYTRAPSDVDTVQSASVRSKQSALSSNGVMRSRTSSNDSARRQDWSHTAKACQEAIDAASILLHLAVGRAGATRDSILRIHDLLEAQLGQLMQLQPYAEGRNLPTLHTLLNLYQKSAAELHDVARVVDAQDTLQTLADVLAEGPDYLIDIVLIEAILWQAEVIDPAFAVDIRAILDRALAQQSDLASFRVAARAIVQAAVAIPDDELDDNDAREAYAAIGALVRQLQTRVASSQAPSQISISDSGRSNTSAPGTTSSAASSSALHVPRHRDYPSRTPSPPADFQSLTASEVQSQFGTGTMPTPSASAAATPAPPSPALSSASSASSQEVWEYKGQLLTRSALSLVLRQEALAMADSSGQYAGEVSWDDVRKAWIPRWAEKLKPEDVPEGVVPSTNPADYKVRSKDPWGNKIGWRNGIMYYEEEPTFELRE